MYLASNWWWKLEIHNARKRRVWELYPIRQQGHLSWRKWLGFQEEEGGFDFKVIFLKGNIY